jgi:hypothetical protein
VSDKERINELAAQDKAWRERRLVDGHGAQDGKVRPEYTPMIVMVCGPIKHWWDENWMSPEHVRYDEWRTKVVQTLVEMGHLAYLPHRAWQGTWNESAQAINNVVIQVADVIIVLTPEGVPSEGTDEEIKEAHKRGTDVIYFPPPASPDEDHDELEVFKRWF